MISFHSMSTKPGSFRYVRKSDFKATCIVNCKFDCVPINIFQQGHRKQLKSWNWNTLKSFRETDINGLQKCLEGL